MSEPYELTIVKDGVWMNFREFIRLISHLQEFGVDAKVETQDEDRALFTLREAVRDQ